MTLREMTKRRRRNPAGTKPKAPKLPEGKAPGEPDKKGEKIRRLVAEENWREALRLAAGLGALGEDKVAIQRAWEAMARPEFTRQLGRDPEALIEAGKEALRRRFGGKA